ncbi:MAG: oxidoreductase-like domain-containing protein [Pseudomonadota bacterium]
MPEPPDPLDPNACCHSGCEWCVLDLHAEDEARYRSALAAWQQRRGQK